MPDVALMPRAGEASPAVESEGEFALFFETWFDRVYAHAARRWQSRAAAERVTEEVLVRGVAAGVDRWTEAATAAYLLASLRSLESRRGRGSLR